MPGQGRGGGQGASEQGRAGLGRVLRTGHGRAWQSPQTVLETARPIPPEVPSRPPAELGTPSWGKPGHLGTNLGIPGQGRVAGERNPGTAPSRFEGKASTLPRGLWGAARRELAICSTPCFVEVLAQQTPQFPAPAEAAGWPSSRCGGWGAGRPGTAAALHC